MNMPVHLLLVSGTSVVGQNVLAALARRRSDVRIAATSSVDVDLALFDFDAAYLVPPTARREAYFERMTAIVAEARPDLVVPCRDEDVLALAELAMREPAVARVVLAGSREAAAAMCDKWESWRFSQAHALPFVPSLRTGSEDDAPAFAAEHGFPLIAKPRAGFGSRGIRLLTNVDQLAAVMDRDGLVVQPFHGDRTAVLAWGREIENSGVPLFHSFEPVKRAGQAMVTPDGAVEGLQCTRNTMAGGFSTRVVVDADPMMRSLTLTCARAFAEAGWRGPFNVQCVEDEHGALRIHEFNGRFTGATAAQLLLGQDDVGLAIQRFTGRAIAAAPRASAPAHEVIKVPRSCAPDMVRLEKLRRTGRFTSE